MLFKLGTNLSLQMKQFEVQQPETSKVFKIDRDILMQEKGHLTKQIYLEIQ